MAVGTTAWAQGNWEGAGPSSRRTGVAVTEIHYHPAPREDGKNLEFIELYNSQPWTEDVSGWRLAGDVEFTLPAGTQIPGLGYLVVAAAPTDLQAVYGLTGVVGGSPGAGDTEPAAPLDRVRVNEILRRPGALADGRVCGRAGPGRVIEGC